MGMTFDAYAAEKGFFLGNAAFNGEFMRFDRNGKIMNAWFVGQTISYESQGQKKTFKRATFGDWVTGEKHEWRSVADAEHESDRAAIEKALSENQEKYALEKRAKQEAASLEAQRIWERGSDSLPAAADLDHYLKTKGVSEVPTQCRFLSTHSGPALLVPAKDIDGKLWGVQTIYPDGSKLFQRGMRIKGCFHVIRPTNQQEGDFYEPEKIYICEGIATAATISAAVETHPVVSAFNAGNLLSVCTALRERFPAAKLVVCADNDHETQRPDGRPWNPGLEAARLCAASVPETTVVCPSFTGDSHGLSDFNDLHATESLDQVRHQLGLGHGGGEIPSPIGHAVTDARTPSAGTAEAGGTRTPHLSPLSHGPSQPGEPGPGTGEEPNSTARDARTGVPETGAVVLPRLRGERRASALSLPEVSPLPPKIVDGKPRAQPHQVIANYLLALYGDNLVKQERNLFQYTGTHWRYVDRGAEDKIRQQLQVLAGGILTAPQLESVFKLFVTHARAVPENVNLFESPADYANFLNGTLYMSRDYGERDLRLMFRAHSREDYLVNVLPYDYNPEAPENPEFNTMLSRLFAGDPDEKEKLQALKQMFGACLMPSFPHLFMCHGVPNTGKSTILKLAARFLHSDNICSVDPTEFHGFNLETMAGKLANIDTDIEMHQPMSEKIIKKIDDRIRVRIRRKGLKDINAPIPALHLFGGNGIPKALDGASRAQDRRWTFMEFCHVIANGENFGKDYDAFIMERGAGAILKFALEGLADILSRPPYCRYIQPASGKAKMEEWQMTTDPVAQFFEDAKTGEIVEGNSVVILEKGAKILRGRLWLIFRAWFEEVHPGRLYLTKHGFYGRVKGLGYQIKTVKGAYFFEGVGVRGAGASEV